VRDANTDLDQAREDLRDVRSQLLEREREKAELVGDVDAMVGNLRELERSLHDAREREVAFVARVGEAEEVRDAKERERLVLAQTLNARDAELARLRDKCALDVKDAIDYGHKEVEDLRTQHSLLTAGLEKELNETHDRLSEALTQLELSQRSLRTLEARVRELNTEQAAYRQEAGRAVADATAIAEEMGERAREAEEDSERRFTEYTRDRERLIKEASDLREQVARVMVQNDKAQRDWRESELRCSDAENEARKARKDYATMQTLMESKIAGLTRQLELSRQTHARELETLRGRVAEADMTTEKLVSEARLLVMQQDEACASIRKEHKGVVQGLRAELTEAFNELNDARNRLLSERTLHRDVNEAHVKAAGDLDRMEREATRLRAAEKTAMERLSEERKRRADAEVKVAKMQVEVHGLKRTVAVMESQLASMRAQRTVVTQ
jgi:chromosome segregation ATPase